VAAENSSYKEKKMGTNENGRFWCFLGLESLSRSKKKKWEPMKMEGFGVFWA